jgi:DNA-directed RNA polymerase specialized sigma24 family protein
MKHKAKALGAEERLLGAFVEQARNIARFRLRDEYDSTVAYDAAHRAMLALKDFDAKSALSTWFYRIAQNETFSELGRLLKKREREESINCLCGAASRVKR